MTTSRLCLFAVILLAACQKEATLAPAENLVPVFDKYQAQWTAAGITSYTMDQERLCFCASGAKARITVVNGVITAATYTATGDFVPAGVRSQYHTIPELFALMRSAYAATPDVIGIQWDPTLGYPLQLNVDPKKSIADDEYTINTTNLVKSTAR